MKWYWDMFENIVQGLIKRAHFPWTVINTNKDDNLIYLSFNLEDLTDCFDIKENKKKEDYRKEVVENYLNSRFNNVKELIKNNIKIQEFINNWYTKEFVEYFTKKILELNSWDYFSIKKVIFSEPLLNMNKVVIELNFDYDNFSEKIKNTESEKEAREIVKNIWKNLELSELWRYLSEIIANSLVMEWETYVKSNWRYIRYYNKIFNDFILK